MREPTTNLVDVGSVALTVSDQERALRFYADTLGFEVRLDVSLGDGGRWVQVVAPGGRVPIALVPGPGAGRTGADTGITLATSDAEADHAALAARGVDVDELLRWPGVPAMFAFRDRDGNRLKVVQTAGGAFVARED
jgi:catechol 2,3-dioxygenase-like lactoylglutathione lyase family enzyme